MIIDLTKPLNASFIPYTHGKYSDPPLEMTEWSSIAQEGFLVTRLILGTQSGTHIDAPGHFLENGALLETLPSDQLMGSYFLLNLSDETSCSFLLHSLKAYRDEKILFLRTAQNKSAKLTGRNVQEILSLPPALIVVSGDIQIENKEPFAFHRMVAEASKYLVEDLEQEAAKNVGVTGELFVFPLRLTGVSGSPCRVVARVN